MKPLLFRKVQRHTIRPSMGLRDPRTNAIDRLESVRASQKLLTYLENPGPDKEQENFEILGSGSTGFGPWIPKQTGDNVWFEQILRSEENQNLT